MENSSVCTPPVEEAVKEADGRKLRVGSERFWGLSAVSQNTHAIETQIPKDKYEWSSKRSSEHCTIQGKALCRTVNTPHMKLLALYYIYIAPPPNLN